LRIPETAALRHFWPRISTGGIVLFDDYAYFAITNRPKRLTKYSSLGAEILILPTGQGLIANKNREGK